MKIEAVALPSLLTDAHRRGRTVVVFDVLRATTTLTAAVAAGVAEVRVFPDPDAARAAARAFGPSGLLCGERDCLPPPGFDLGNSPGAFAPDRHAARTVFMATTNGTRAILAAQAGADAVLVGALVNARAVAGKIVDLGRDATLLCAGTNGQIAAEDLIGAGAVIARLEEVAPGRGRRRGDTADIAVTLFRAAERDLATALRNTTGGRNVVNAGLAPDVAFAARLDVIDVVGKVEPRP